MGDVKTIIKKWIAILIILVIFLGQYAITGFLATSYAIDLLSIHENVQFRAYFKNGEEELTEIEKSIDAKDLKLKIDVAVKNQGYFNGQISLQNAGFKFDEVTDNSYINKIENNIIYLNQINSEETASIEVGIKYFEDDKIQASTLNQTTTVKLNGTYTSSDGSNTIDGGSDVKVIWKVPENTKAELSSKLQTNYNYQINGENKDIVQFLITSKLTNNAYPIKNTQITATIPEGATKVEVHKRSIKSTNDEQDFTTENYKVENNILTININNTEVDGKISWIKGFSDIIVVTYEFPENTVESTQNITINEKITTQNNIELNADQVQLSLAEVRYGIANISKLEEESNIYKGKIYADNGRDITSYSMVHIDYIDGVEDIEVTEYGGIFGKKEERANDLLQSTLNTGKFNLIKNVKINKDEVASVLGNTWSLTIGDKTITNETQTDESTGIIVDENGNISINLGNGVKTLTIKTSKPLSNGSFKIETRKSIVKGEYTREQIKEFEKIVDGSSIKYTDKNNNTFTLTSFYNIGLIETETKASLQSEQVALIAGTNAQSLNLKVLLESNGENQDLYKNPEIKIKLPSQVKNVTYVQKPQLFQPNGLQLTDENYKVIEENGQKVLSIKLTGEQTNYLGEAIQGTTISINTNVEIDQNAQNTEEEIVMTYTNENATKYTDNGTEKVKIQISAAQTQGGNTGSEGQGENQGTGTGSEGQGENQGTETGSEGQGENQGTETGSEGQGENQGTETGSGTEQTSNTELKYEVTASVGGQTISEGDTVKAGEIIVYTVKLQNPSTQNIENVSLSATIPNNTTLIEVNSKYPAYDEEKHVYTTDEEYFVTKTERTLEKNGININAGKTYEYKYMVKVNSDVNLTQEIESDYTIRYGSNSKNFALKNKIEPAALEANLNLAYMKDDDKVSYGYTYIYQLYIKNNTNEEKKNVQVNLNINDLMEKKSIVYTSNEPRQEVETDELYFTIPSIQANNEAYVEYEIKIKDSINGINYAEAMCTIKDSDNVQYRSNKVSNEVSGIRASLELIGNKNDKSTINLGDEIIYTIKIKNIGDSDSNDLILKDKYSKYLDLQSVTIDGKDCEYNLTGGEEADNYNLLEINCNLKAEEEKNIIIKGKVKELSLLEDFEVINEADAYDDILLASSGKITYYLKAPIYPEDDNPDEENPGEENPGEDNPGEDNPGQDNPGQDNPGDNSQDEDNQKTDNKDDTSNQQGENNNTNKGAISGIAWLDRNQNGQRESDEEIINGVKVTLYNIETNSEITSTTTDSNGLYSFTNIESGKYVVLFEYDNQRYSITTYKADGTSENNNSDVEIITMNINNASKKVASTDTITVNEENITNIDIGLVEYKKFDLNLSKTISKVSVSNSGENKTTEFSDTNLAKVEIRGKYLKGSVVMVEYKIKVTNNGELAGYAKKIVDNKPSDLKFNSKLNKDWYQSGNKLYTESLANTKIEPGETKEITLILTKTMTNSNTGLTNNKAEITEYYNELGVKDEGSSQDDDVSQADLIISVSTGIAVKFSIITLIIAVIMTTLVYSIVKKVIRKKFD